MTQTIEEAARAYSERLGKCRDVTWNDGEYGFIAGANYIMSLPLASRLTPAEKERVKDEYYEAKTFCENVDPCGESYARNEAGMFLLERIFGAEIFKEEE